MKFLAILLLSLPFIVGCQERYRYPCQDPENWSLKQCQKPYCSANGTCPEDLRHYEKNGENSNNNSSRSCSGSCK
jgi:hypothetical protein